ncbi:hypothetical protein WICPIJ_007184 [Wickerhamomyces pijperi]|uniref:Uncharacterized protein n=1 Tax=Wickerhamomyces pijperi TaxID=599730 RepID=A0A9P8Q0R4_WICPI|nr:hypothetical protein WICPIJ_007184 [Wickerhamomyces pijperi]
MKNQDVPEVFLIGQISNRYAILEVPEYQASDLLKEQPIGASDMQANQSEKPIRVNKPNKRGDDEREWRMDTVTVIAKRYGFVSMRIFLNESNSEPSERDAPKGEFD